MFVLVYLLHRFDVLAVDADHLRFEEDAESLQKITRCSASRRRVGFFDVFSNVFFRIIFEFFDVQF